MMRDYNSIIDEGQLLKEVSIGSLKAYKRLFMAYYSPLCEYALYYIADDEAEDVVQELMISLWEGRRLLTDVSSIRSYLFAATKNRCLNRIKQRTSFVAKHYRFYEEMDTLFDDPDFYLTNELSSMIDRAIAELPEPYRVVFEMSRFSDRTNVQIAEELGVSVKTIEHRITQSLKILRIKLGDYLYLMALFPSFTSLA